MPGSPATQPEARWRARAVERSLRSARAKAESRSERFIAAATELLHETGSIDFTVQELVERSGMSLRSFYQHFASKDDLLLAVFEEAIRAYTDTLRSTTRDYTEPIEQLRAYVTGFYEASAVDEPVSRALSKYLLLLTQTRPSELARVLEPQTTLLLEIVEAGVTAGQLRSDVPVRNLCLLITQTVMAAVEMRVLGTYLMGDHVDAEDLWRFCTRGVLAADPPPAGPRRLARSRQQITPG